MKPKVVLENNNFLFINKPTGWVVNEAKTTGNNPVIQTWIREKFDFPLAKDREYRNGIVHRLDKGTSGVLIVAKTRKAFEFAQKQFKKRKVEKTYLLLAHGKIELKVGTIEAPVGRLPWNRERFGVIPGGRDSLTKYKVVEYLLDDDKKHYTLVEAYPKTGRTHQIRIHLKHIGHPIVSDTFYAGRKTNRTDRLWCPRLFLHALRIKIADIEGGELEVEAPLSKDLSYALKKLKKPN